ncbi:MAG: BTAD domain-containing putative transcriptional regulator, partial [Rubrivivax sp.]|nr:BTAD domain-containing putative transcriptional regulator [Rubrivivax sp.]
MLELHLLGTVSLRRDGAALSLPIRKTQALLLLLAMSGRQPRARVVSLLWPALDEPTGRRNLRRELARLREIGAGDAVQAESDFLALGEGVATDVQQLSQAVAQGRHADALALWRGPPADGLALDDAAAFLEWWQPEAERLRALRQRTLGLLAVAQEDAGDAEGALAHVQTQLAEEPLQEQLHRDAMRLQARCGRREAALAQYERCRALLASELGLAPMAETEALAAKLRAGPAAAPASQANPALPRAATAPAALPQLPASLPFVGRESEIAALEMAWRAGRAVLIEGEGGLGKTRLATDFAAAHGPYARVRTRPGDGAVPYAAFARALRELAGPQPDFTALPSWAQAELARVLPELGPPPPPIRHPQERGRFIEACTQAWLLVAADSFDAVILDDWHNADHASAELLAFIAQRRREQHPAGAREWLLLRPEMPEPVRQSLLRLQAGADALHLQMAPLADAAVFELVQCLSGVAEPRRFAARLGHATRGNPFFMAETLRHLAERELLSLADDGSWRTPFDDATDDYRELPVPKSVHEAVLERVQRLPAPVRRVLEAAALAAEPFLPALLAPACALSELDTVLAIDEAVQVHLLREHEQGGYAFAHDLVQQALEGALPEARCRLVHRRLALGAEAARAAPALIAAHHEASGDRVRAVAHRIAAGDQAWALHALPEAIDHWQQALADGATAAQAVLLHRHLMRAAFLSERQAMSLEHAHLLQALVTGAELQATQSEDERVLALTDVARYLAYNEQQPEALALLDGLPATTSDLQRARVLA